MEVFVERTLIQTHCKNITAITETRENNFDSIRPYYTTTEWSLYVIQLSKYKGGLKSSQPSLQPM